MQCEFSKAELIRLDLAIMERIERAKVALPSLEESEAEELQHANIEQLEALHEKLDGLIGQAERMEEIV